MNRTILRAISALISCQALNLAGACRGFFLEVDEVKGTVHEKNFFPGKDVLGPSKYGSGKKIPDQIKQGA